MRKIAFITIMVVVSIAGCNKQQSSSGDIGPPLIINGEEVLGIEWSGNSSSLIPNTYSKPMYIWPIADDKITIPMGYDDGWDPSKHGLYVYLIDWEKSSPRDKTGGTVLTLGPDKIFLPPGEVNAHSVIYHWDKDLWFHGPLGDEMTSINVILTPRTGIAYFIDYTEKCNVE